MEIYKNIQSFVLKVIVTQQFCIEKLFVFKKILADILYFANNYELLVIQKVLHFQLFKCHIKTVNVLHFIKKKPISYESSFSSTLFSHNHFNSHQLRFFTNCPCVLYFIFIVPVILVPQIQAFEKEMQDLKNASQHFSTIGTKEEMAKLQSFTMNFQEFQQDMTKTMVVCFFFHFVFLYYYDYLAKQSLLVWSL